MADAAKNTDSYDDEYVFDCDYVRSRLEVTSPAPITIPTGGLDPHAGDRQGTNPTPRSPGHTSGMDVQTRPTASNDDDLHEDGMPSPIRYISLTLPMRFRAGDKRIPLTKVHMNEECLEARVPDAPGSATQTSFRRHRMPEPQLDHNQRVIRSDSTTDTAGQQWSTTSCAEGDEHLATE